MPNSLTRRELMKVAAGWAGGLTLARTDRFARLLAAEDNEPRQLAHVLSNETYSFRDLIGAGKLSLLTAAEFHKKLDIKGVSLNDLYFESWEKTYLNKILDSFRANDRVITCLIMEGNLATPKQDARKKQIEDNTRKLKAASYLEGRCPADS